MKATGKGSRCPTWRSNFPTKAISFQLHHIFLCIVIYIKIGTQNQKARKHTHILYFLFTFDMCSGIHPAQPPTTVPSGSVTVASSEAIQGSGCLFIAGVEDASSQATTLIMGQVLVPGMGHVGLESSFC